MQYLWYWECPECFECGRHDGDRTRDSRSHGTGLCGDAPPFRGTSMTGLLQLCKVLAARCMQPRVTAWTLGGFGLLEGEWSDTFGDNYSLTLDWPPGNSYTVDTRRQDGRPNRRTRALIYNLREGIFWGREGQYRLLSHGGRCDRTTGRYILTNISWSRVCTYCDHYSLDPSFVWFRRGELPPPPPPAAPPPPIRTVRASSSLSVPD